MIRKAILMTLVIVLIAGAYAAKGTFETVAAMAETAWDLSNPQPTKVQKNDEITPASGEAPKAAPPAGFARKFNNSLMVMEDGKPQGLDVNKLAGVKYWAFYYSASWCPPCRAFTPQLVTFYREFKPSHPNFELIFVSLDHSEDDMLNYVRNDAMPWPSVWYPDIDNPELEAKKYCGSGIPCLVLVDADGHVISDTFQGAQYTDPHHVIDDIRAAVQ